MTQQLSILELAKRGDAKAIAVLINRSLQPKGITAQVSLDRQYLNIVLRSAQIPNQKSIVELIYRGMMILQVQSIKEVHVEAYRDNSEVLAWESEFAVTTLALNSLSSASNKTVPSLVPTKNPDDVIHIQKQTQLSHNHQESQDIIIRFVDTRSGAVRCLSTLSELMQVINRSNPTFASASTNSTLANLLDAIEEYSSTDEKGDRVIANVSILQPGQPWQKVKIRLVTQVYFEPESHEEFATPEPHIGITLDADKTPTVPVDIPAQGDWNIASQSSLEVQQKLEKIAREVKIQNGFATVSDNLLDDLIQDLDPDRESNQTESLSAKEKSLTVGEFLDDFGSDLDSKKAGTSIAKKEEKSPTMDEFLDSFLEELDQGAKAVPNAPDSAQEVTKSKNQNIIDTSIDSLFDQFDLQDDNKSDTQNPSTKADHEEMITLDNFL
jgi:hypothetical protein